MKKNKKIDEWNIFACVLLVLSSIGMVWHNVTQTTITWMCVVLFILQLESIFIIFLRNVKQNDELDWIGFKWFSFMITGISQVLWLISGYIIKEMGPITSEDIIKGLKGLGTVFGALILIFLFFAANYALSEALKRKKK